MNINRRLQTLFILLIVSFLASVWLFWIIQSKNLLEELIENKISVSHGKVIEELSRIATPVEFNLNVIKNWGTSQNLKDLSKEELNRFLMPVLEHVPGASGVILADSTGWMNFLYPKDSLWEFSISDGDFNSRNGYLYDWDGSIANNHRDYSSDLVIQKRPWYRGAIDTVFEGQIYWTKPYEFYNTKEVGITASVSWISQSGVKQVAAIDLLFEDIVKTIGSLEVGNREFAFLLNRRGDILFENRLFQGNHRKTQEIITQQSVKKFDPRESDYKESFVLNGKKFWIQYKLLEPYMKYMWLGLVIPDSELTTHIKIKQKKLLIYFLFPIGLLVILFALWIRSKFFDINLVSNTEELNRVFSNSSDPESFLSSSVKTVAKLMKSPVCSIYFYDESRNRLILKATHGLNKDLVNITSLEYGEGLVGQTLKELRSLNVSHASDLQEYTRVDGLNEDIYDTFLTIPIVRGVHKIGVMVVQRSSSNPYSNKEFRTIEILAAQLTSVLETAGLLLSFSNKEDVESEKTFQEPEIVKGKVASPGYAHGKVLHDHRMDNLSFFKKREWDKFNLEDFRLAVASTGEDLEELQLRVEDKLDGSAAMIFTAHLLMLKDPSYKGAIEELIARGINPPEAVLHVTEELMRTFSLSPSRTIKEKVDDVKDLSIRLLCHLSSRLDVEEKRNGKIIIAKELLPSDILVMSIEKVAGIILKSGGVTSHLAILCRSLNIPMIISDDGDLFNIKESSTVLMDAALGMVYVNPDTELMNDYLNLEENAQKDYKHVKAKCSTADGKLISVLANVNLTTDVVNRQNLKIQGVGLYRTEFPFLIRNDFPSEEEQYSIYKKVADHMHKKEMTFRTLDIGGDKVLSYYENTEEVNPFLGLRAIRFSLKEKGLFREQIKAILRAGMGTDLRIMFPMIQSVDELREARVILNGCIDELKGQKIECHCKPKIGIMIEIPATVLIIDELAEEVDFFSIGTNDLIQYYLAVDRTNSQVSSLYQPHHPAILKAIKRIAYAAQAKGIDLSVCGDMAGSSKHIPFLIGCGITKLSVDPIFMPRVRETVRGLNNKDCVFFADKLLKCRTVAEANQVIEKGI